MSFNPDSRVKLTGAIRGTSTEKIYNELGLETQKLKKEDGTGSYAASIKFIKVILRNIFLTLFPLLSVDITQEIPITFLKLK